MTRGQALSMRHTHARPPDAELRGSPRRTYVMIPPPSRIRIAATCSRGSPASGVDEGARARGDGGCRDGEKLLGAGLRSQADRLWQPTAQIHQQAPSPEITA